MNDEVDHDHKLAVKLHTIETRSDLVIIIASILHRYSLLPSPTTSAQIGQRSTNLDYA